MGFRRVDLDLALTLLRREGGIGGESTIAIITVMIEWPAVASNYILLQAEELEHKVGEKVVGIRIRLYVRMIHSYF